ncbi:MAG TPA: homoserine kinase [Vicinamibacterales bacterium]|jgi:homoserine kinase
MSSSVRVFAPASASNLGPGFDVLGLALERPGDVVEAEWSDEAGIQIVEVSGEDGALSRDPRENVAGVAATSVLSHLVASGHPPADCRVGIRLRVHKQMPLASGLGSSAASSVAGAMAVNELLGRPLARRDLLVHALAGERAAAGSTHADNVAPSLLGGIVLIRGYDPLEIVDLPVPSALRIVVVHPHCRVETSKARAMLRGHGFPIEQVVANLGNVGAFVAALYREDLELLGRSIDDRMVEPLRMPLVPGYGEVKAAATRAGALGCAMSGSGPSLFAFSDSDVTAARVAAAMCEAFREAARLESEHYVGRVNIAGAVLIAET